jgi:hypothetical protein
MRAGRLILLATASLVALLWLVLFGYLIVTGSVPFVIVGGLAILMVVLLVLFAGFVAATGLRATLRLVFRRRDG